MIILIILISSGILKNILKAGLIRSQDFVGFQN